MSAIKLIWATLMEHGFKLIRSCQTTVRTADGNPSKRNPSYYLEFTKRNPVNQIFLKGTYTKEGYRSVLEV